MQMAAIARRLFFASTPPILYISLSNIPDSLSHLNFLSVQIFLQYYFNGRIAKIKRSRSAGQAQASISLLDPRFNRDMIAFAICSVIAFVSYALLLKVLLTPK